jgi:hypothetical protein
METAKNATISAFFRLAGDVAHVKRRQDVWDGWKMQ